MNHELHSRILYLVALSGLYNLLWFYCFAIAVLFPWFCCRVNILFSSNTCIMSKIQVFVRLRPVFYKENEEPEETCIKTSSNSSLEVISFFNILFNSYIGLNLATLKTFKKFNPTLNLTVLTKSLAFFTFLHTVLL